MKPFSSMALLPWFILMRKIQAWWETVEVFNKLNFMISFWTFDLDLLFYLFLECLIKIIIYAFALNSLLLNTNKENKTTIEIVNTVFVSRWCILTIFRIHSLIIKCTGNIETSPEPIPKFQLKFYILFKNVNICVTLGKYLFKSLNLSLIHVLPLMIQCANS